MPYRAVMFDLDGTLLDTLEDLADSMNAVLSRWGFPEHKLDAYRYFVGDGVENLVRRCLPPADRVADKIQTGVAAMRREYSQRWENKSRPYPGISQLLDALSARNVRMTILSNKPDDFTRMMVARLLPDWSFDEVAGAKPSIPKKPDPVAALDIARRLGISPGEFLYLGDTNTDMKTAVAAGMFPVGVLWGFRPGDELQESGAKALIAQPMELLDLL